MEVPEIHQWQETLTRLGAHEDHVSALAKAFEEFLLRPDEVAQLIAEFRSRGPGIFSGFQRGQEKELALELDAIRSKDRDIDGMHERPSGQHLRGYTDQ